MSEADVMTAPTCKEVANQLISNFDASAPFVVIDRERKMNISEVNITKDENGTCVLVLRMEPYSA